MELLQEARQYWGAGAGGSRSTAELGRGPQGPQEVQRSETTSHQTLQKNHKRFSSKILLYQIIYHLLKSIIIINAMEWVKTMSPWYLGKMSGNDHLKSRIRGAVSKRRTRSGGRIRTLGSISKCVNVNNASVFLCSLLCNLKKKKTAKNKKKKEKKRKEKKRLCIPDKGCLKDILRAF